MTKNETVLGAYEKVKTLLFEAEDFTEERKEGLKKLFNFLENETEWLKAPCSTRYHCSYEGGLLEHSVNVARQASRLAKILIPNYSINSVIMIGLLHDCGKYCQYYQKEPTPAQKQYGYPGSYATNTAVPYMGHEDRSAWIVSKYIDLTEEEFSAIVLHNEPWLTNTCQFQHCPLSTVIQYADYWACMYLEDRG